MRISGDSAAYREYRQTPIIPHSINLIPTRACFPVYTSGEGMVSTGRPIERTMLTRTQESTDNDTSSSIVYRKESEPIIIDGQDDIFSVAVLADGKHIVSGDREGKIRRWRIEDGREVGTPMDAGSSVFTIAVSRDGKWIVSGTERGLVTVWNAESHSKVTEFKAHDDCVCVVDVSPDATKIATGSDDRTARVWSLSTGERLLSDSLEHDHWVVAAKFSPNGCLIATATWARYSVRVYDSQDGSFIVEFPVQVHSTLNQSLAWASDSKQLFALSHDGYIHCVDVLTMTTLSKWHIRSSNNPTCITLIGNGKFIAASAGSLVSFWDTASQEQIGTVVEYSHNVRSMAMSSSYHLVTSGDMRITLQALSGTHPSLHSRILDSKIAHLEKTVQEQAESQRAANEEKDRLNEIIKSLRAGYRTRDESSSASISTESYVSLTSMSTRQQNRASGTDQPRTLRPTCRLSTQSRWSHSD